MTGRPWARMVLNIATFWSWWRLSWRLYVTMWCTVSSTAMPMAMVAMRALPVLGAQRGQGDVAVLGGGRRGRQQGRECQSGGPPHAAGR
jgi:hypothetical protein